jgi:hypothetical protein
MGDTIDLHVHSCFSDGTCTPKELVNLAVSANLTAFALTDHDTVDGVADAITYGKEQGIQVIPGVELSCEYQPAPGQKKEIHILGYNIDYTSSRLLHILSEVAVRRDERNRKMCKRLYDGGFPITYEELCERFPSTILTRAHFARFLFEKGAVGSVDAAFRKILSQDSPYFVTRDYLTPETAIRIIKEAGGIPVLAHPLLYKFSVSEIRILLTQLKDCGLKGIEAIYSRNRGNDEAFVRKLAKEFDLFITGGTDFHGANKPDLSIGIGTGNMKIPATLLENLR